MAGTVKGGKLAAQKNKEIYGRDFYKRIGASGGAKSKGGGYASTKLDKNGLTGKQRARVYGSLGGKIGMHTRWGNSLTEKERKRIHDEFNAKLEANYSHLLKVHKGANK